MITIQKACHGRKVTIVGLEPADILAAVRNIPNIQETNSEGAVTVVCPLNAGDTIEGIEKFVQEVVGKLPPKIVKATPAETRAVNRLDGNANGKG